MELDLNKRNVILAAIFCLLVVAFVALFNFRYNNEEKEELESIVLVTNASRFFQINNAASTFINYLSKEDIDSLMLLLNENFVNERNVTRNNVLDKVGRLLENNYRFQARKMYQEKLSRNIIKYYIHGYLREEVMDSITDEIDYYLIVTMDTANWTFDVTPYNGAIFKEEQ